MAWISTFSNVVDSRLGADLLGTSVATANDTLHGTNSSDWMDGFAGDDTLHGNAGDDFLLGRSGSDTLYGGSGDDILIGGDGNDSLHGNEGNDLIVGGEGNDSISGYYGNNSISGGEGNDSIDGGWGDDVILGDKGDDTLYASGGKDVYRFGFGDGADKFIGQGGHAADDRFVFEDDVKSEALWFQKDGNSLIVQILGTEDSITFKDWYAADSTTLNQNIQEFAIESASLSATNVQSLVNAMAAFEPNDGTTAYGVKSNDLPSQVQVAVSNAWQVA